MTATGAPTGLPTGDARTRHDDTENQCDGIEPTDVLPTLVLPPNLSPFPNDDAACAAVWVPRIDAYAGFVPQGLALRGDGTALVSGYIHPPEDEKDDKSGEHCRLVGVDLETGARIGHRDFKRATCKHGGGVAIDDQDRVWISDTHKLVMLGHSGGVLSQTGLALPGRLKGLNGSFLVDGKPGRLWVGVWKEDATGKIYEFKISYLTGSIRSGLPIKRKKLTDLRTVPKGTQGAEFKSQALWAASSDSQQGTLKTNHGTFGFGPGVEEIDFEGKCLWAVFEAGAMIYPDPSFPVIARFDPGLIGPSDEPNPECA